MINFSNTVKTKIALLLFLVGMISFTGIGKTTSDLVQNSTEVVKDYQADVMNLIGNNSENQTLAISESYILEGYEPQVVHFISNVNLSTAIDINTPTSVANINEPYKIPKPHIKTKSSYQTFPDKNFKNPRDGLSYVSK
jgi:hypothetical protein